MKKLFATLTLAAFALTTSAAFAQEKKEEPKKTEKKEKKEKKPAEKPAEKK